MERVRNPALLRRLLYLGAPHSARGVPYRRLLGQLDDRGDTAAAYGSGREGPLTDASKRGHLAEGAAGAYLLTRAATDGSEVCWWRGGSKGADFVASDGRHVTAVEAKGGRVKPTGGLEAFCLERPEARTLAVGSAACGVGDFLTGDVGLLP